MKNVEDKMHELLRKVAECNSVSKNEKVYSRRGREYDR